LGVVGVGMFGSARVGYFLWITHVLAALTVGFLFKKGDFRKRKFGEENFALKKEREDKRSDMRNHGNAGKILSDAVKNSMEAITIVGGLIIFFSVVVAILETVILPDGTIFSAVVAGLVEITTGARKISAFSQNIFSLSAAAFVIAFGGFSVHAQSLHFFHGTGIKNRSYFFAKFLHSVFAAAFTVIFFLTFF
jgi:hypothetical protein